MDSAPTSSGESSILRYERLRRGSYFADFRRDIRTHPEVYHGVIQRDGSDDVLWWGQHRTLQAAIEAAELELKRLVEAEQAGLFDGRRVG